MTATAQDGLPPCYQNANWFFAPIKTSASKPILTHNYLVAQAHPIHLWDACSGSLRCVYRAYDAADEITAAYSLAFDGQGSRIWAGYNKAIRLFDLSRPGRDCQTITTFQKGQDGQPGQALNSVANVTPFVCETTVVPDCDKVHLTHTTYAIAFWG